LILACVVLTQCQRVTDGRTDRRTDNSTVAMLTPCKNEVRKYCTFINALLSVYCNIRGKHTPDNGWIKCILKYRLSQYHYQPLLLVDNASRMQPIASTFVSVHVRENRSFSCWPDCGNLAASRPCNQHERLIVDLIPVEIK